MENYYNSLNGGMVTWFKKTSAILFGPSMPDKAVASTFRNSYTQILFVLLLAVSLFGGQQLSAQTILSQDFEGATFPPTGWVVTNAGFGNNWVRSTATSSPAQNGSSTAYMLYGYSSSSDANTWAFTPNLALVSGQTYSVEFQSAATSFVESLKVTIGQGQTVAAQTTVLGNYPSISSSTYVKRVISFTVPTSGNYNIAFNCYSIADQFNFVVDDVAVKIPVTANAAPISFTTSSITKSGMTIGWTDNSTNETSFRVYRSTDNVNFTQVGSDIASTTSAGTGTTYSSVQTGLSTGQTYYFRIGAAVDGDSAYLTGSQSTLNGATYYWVGASGAAWQSPNSWNTAANGSGSARTQPANDDTLIFDGAGTTPGAATNVVLQGSQTIGTLQITNNTAVSIEGYSSSLATITLSGAGGDDLSVPSGSSLTLNHSTFPVAIAFTGTGNTGNIAGTLNLGGSGSNNISTTSGTGTVVTVSGTINNGGTISTTQHISGSAATLFFTSSGVYNHTYALGGTVPTANWNTSSNVNFTGLTSAATSVSLGSGQIFGNVTWNPTSQGSANINLAIGSTTTIAGNFTVSNTGSGGSLGLTNTSGMTLNVTGNYLQSGGYVYVTTGSSTGIVAVTGNATISSGATLDLASSSGAATFRVGGSFTNNGTLTESGTTTASTLEFNGSVAQAVNVGTALNNITYRINNNAGINLTGALAIANGSGLIISSTAATPINGGTLTYAGSGTTLTYNSTTGSQTPTANEWKSSAGPNNVVINNTTAAPNNRVFLGTVGNRTISGGNFAQTSGVTVLDGSNLTIAASGTLSGTASSTNFVATNGSGKLLQAYGGSVLSRTFPLGDITGTDEASSVTLTFSILTGTSTVGLGVTDAQHPNDASTTNFLSRYFSFTETGASDYTYNLTLNYPSGEVTGLNALTRLSRWNGSAWNTTNATIVPGTSSVAVTGVTFANDPLNNSAFTLRPYQGTYTWKGGTSGSFATAANWSPSRTTPDATDVLIFDGSNIDGASGTGAISATSVASQTIGKLQLTNNANVSLYSNASATITINGSEGVDFDIQAGSTLSSTGTQAVSFAHTSNASPNANTATIAGTLNLNSTAASNYSATNSVTTVTGTINNTSGTFTSSAATLVFGAGANYNHLYPSGGAVPTATWNVTANTNFPGPSTSTAPTNVGGQTFGNFNWNPTAQGTAVINLGLTSAVTIGGNLTISSTGSNPSATQSSFGFFSTTTGAYTITVNGNFNLNSGYLVGSTTGTGSAILVKGNATLAANTTYDLSTGTSGTSYFYFNNSLTNNGTITVTGTGTGSFIIFNGTTNQSVTAGTITGNINYAQFNDAGVNLNGSTLSVALSRTLQVATVSTAPFTNGTINYATGSFLSYTAPVGNMFITDVTFPATNGPTTLVINNTAAAPNNRVSFNTTGDRSVTTLTNTAGVLLLGNNSLTTTAFSGTPSATNFVATNGTGQLKYVFSAISSATFPLGDITGTDELSTVVLNYSVLPTASTVGARVTDAQSPNDASASNFLSRYFSFTESGGGAATYSLTLNYPSTDVTGSAGSTKLNRWNGSAWNEVAATTPTSTSVAVTGLSLTANGLNGTEFTLRPASRTYVWNGSVDTAWTTAGNWTPARTTADPADELTFDGGSPTVTAVPTQTIARLLLTNNANVTLQSPANNTLTIAGAAGTDLDIPSGSTLNLTNNAFSTAIAFSGTGNTGTIAGTLNLGGLTTNTLTTTGGTSTVVTVTGTTNVGSASGSAAMLVGSAATLIYSGTASYNHNFVTGGTVPTATWGSTTNLNFPGPNDATTAISIGNQTYGNFNWNPTNQGAANINLTMGNAMTIAGNMNISTTGATGSLAFATTGSSTYTVSGSYTQGNNTKVVLSTGTGSPTLAIAGAATIGTGSSFDLASGSGSGTLRVAGDLTNNGTLTESGTSTASTINFSGAGAQAVAIGTNLNTLSYSLTNASAVNLTGSLAVTNGASFTHTSTGTVTGSGSIVYSGAATTLSYTGSTARTQGLEWPATFGSTAANVTINLSSSARLTMTGSRSLTSGTFTMTSGVTLLGNNDLTLGSAVTFAGTPSTTNFIATNGTGQLFKTYAATGSFTFPLGDVDGTDELSTFVLNYTALTGTSTVGLRVIDAQHPADTSTDNFISRYFKVTETGSSAYTYTTTLNYVAADFVGTPSFSKLYRYNGSAFVAPTAGAIGGTTTTTSTGAIAGYLSTSDPLNGSDFTVRPYNNTYTWTNGAADGLWTTGGNWSPARPTASASATDILLFNTTSTITAVPTQTVGKIVLSGSANIQLQGAASAVLTIGGGAGTDLDVPSGTSLSINGNNAWSLAYGTGATANIAGTFTHGGGTAIVTHNVTGAQVTVGGTYNNTGAVINAFTGFSTSTFLMNGNYNLNVSGAVAAIVPTGTYALGSTVTIAPSLAVAAAPALGTQSFGNFVVNGTGSGAVVSTGTPTINGNLTITSTGTGSYSFGTATVTVNGLTTVTAGTLTSNGNTFNLNGGLTQNGGTITTTATGTTINVGSASSPGVFTQNAGTITHAVATAGAMALNLYGDATIAGTISETALATGSFAIGFRKTISGTQNITTTGITQTGSFSYTSTNTPGLNLTGTLLVNGTSPASSFTHNGLGVISGGTFTYGAGSSLTYSSSGGSQTPGSEWPATNAPVSVTINNTTTAPNNRVFFSSLSGDRATTTFTQTGGVLVLGSNSLSVTTLSGTASNTNFVATNGSGQLKYTYSAIGSATFPLGDITNTDEASAVTLSYTALTGTSTVGVRVTDAKNPNETSSTDYLARYYSFTESGASAASTATLTLNYPTANVVGTNLNTRLSRWNGSAWTQVSGTVPGTGSVSISGIDYTAFNGNDFTLRPAATQTYTWVGGTSGAYNTGASWSPARPTASADASDILVFDGNNINGSGGTGNINVTTVLAETVGKIILQNNANVTLNTALSNCALTINGGTGTDLDIPSGSTLTLFGQSTNSFTLGFTASSNATANIAGNFNLGDSTNTTAAHTYTFTNGITTIAPTGTFTNFNNAGGGVTSASASTLIINGTYVHNPGNTQGGTIPTATVAVTSTVHVKSGATSVTFPAANTIGNLILNNIATGTTSVSLGLTSATVQGNLTVNSTGASTGGIAFGSSPTVTVNGTTTITAGKFDLANSSSGGATFNALGNVVMNGGSIGAASTSGVNTLNVGNIGTATSLTMNSGSTITSASSSTTGGITLNLFGDLTMNSGSTITESSAAGVVLVNFAKTLGGSQNTAFNGTVSNSVLFRQSNTVGVNLTGTLTLDGAVTPAASFTHASTGVISGSGAVSYSGTGSLLTYNGATNQTAGLEWSSTNSPSNVTINNTGSATTNLVSVPFSRTIGGTLTMTAGNIDLTSNTLTLGTSAAATGTLTYTAGTIRVTSGAFTRWYGASGLPTAASSTGAGFYPLASGANNRAATVYFSTGTITTGGTVSVSHTDATALADVAFTDGAYAIDKRSNASWTFTQGNGLTLGATTAGVQLKTAGNGAFSEVLTTNTNLRLVKASAAASGTHVNSASTLSPTTFIVNRTGLAAADLSSTYYIGGSIADFPTTFTAVATADWATATTWDKGYAPGPTDTVVIPSPYTVTVGTTGGAGLVTINSGGGLTVSPSATLTLTGAVTNNGTISNQGTLTTTGSLTNGGTVTADASSTTTIGTTLTNNAAKTITNSGAFSVASTFANNGTYTNTTGTASFTTSASALTATGITNGAAASFIVNGGTVNLGISDNTVNNRTFANTGAASILTVSNGTLNVYGNISNGATAFFNQTGGNINIDGNAGGNAANSVASGTPLLSFAALNNRINLTAGTLTIVDPHTATTNTSGYAIFYTNGTVGTQTATAAHLTRFGNGTSADAGGHANGFYLDTWETSALLSLGSVEVNGPSANNRSVSSVYNTPVKGDLTINSNGTVNMGAVVLTLGGNLQVNTGGTFISTGILSLQFVGSNTGSALTGAPSTVTQTIGGAGSIQNAATSPTASLANLGINNTNATGITLTSPLSVSGTLTMTSGLINTTNTNLLTLGTTAAVGTLVATPSATNLIVGPFARVYPASRTASGTYDATTLFPVGKAGVSYSIYADPTTTAGGAVTFKGEAFNTNSGTFAAPVTAMSSRRFEVLPTSGSANLTNVYVRLSDATASSITTSSKILQSPAAAGAYTPIIPSTTAVATTSVTTAAPILAADYTGYLSYGNVTACLAPADQATAITLVSKGTTSVSSSFTAAASAPTGYLVVRYAAGGTVTPPVDFTSYSTGGTLGAGTIVSMGTAASFTASSLSANTAYDFYVYSYNNSASCSGPVYLTTAPLTQTVTTCTSATAAPTALTFVSATGTTANVSWTASSTSGVNYIVDVATNSGFTTFVSGFNALNVGSNLTVSITGLTASTTYYVRVKADLSSCSSANTSTLTITTPCTSVAIPTTLESFTSLTLPSCWTTSQITGTISWAPDNANDGVPSGRNDANFMGKDYTASDALVVAPPIDMTTSTTGGRLDVWVYRNTVNKANDRIRFYANTNANLTGASQLLEVFPLTTVAPTVAAAGWYNYTADIPSTFNTAQALYIIAQGTTDGTSSSYGIGFDDLKVVAQPSCNPPTAPTSSNVTATTATLSWTGSTSTTTGGYDYYISTTNTAPVGNQAGLVNVPTGTSVNLTTGLAANTTYYFWVRTHCSDSDQSTWTATASTFTTPCSSVTAFTQSFDTVTTPALPTCWSSILRGPNVSGNIPSIGTSTSNVFTSPNGVTIYSSGTTTSDDLILVSTPVSNLGAGTHQLRFYAKNDTSGENVQVGTLNGNGSTATFTPLQTVTLTTTYTEYTVPFTAYTGSNIFIGLRKTNGSTYTYIYLDNLVWEAIPTCYPPTGLTASAITTSAATLNWTAPTQGTPSSYQYEIRTSGNPGSGSTGLTASGTGITGLTTSLSGLSSGTTYNAYVRTFCGGSDYSSWTSATSFVTVCSPATAPTTAETFTAFPPNCWSFATGTLAASSTLTASTSSATGWLAEAGFANTGTNPAVRINVYGTKDNWFISNQINLGTGGYRIKYNMALTNYLATTAVTDMGTHKVSVVISTDGGTTWSSANTVKTYSGTTPYSNTGQIEYINIGSYTGTVKVAFVVTTSSTTPDIDFHLDDFQIEALPPSISGFTPASVCTGSSSTSFTNDGTTVAINGGNLTGATSVLFTTSSGTVAGTIQSNTASQIVAVIPTGAVTGPVTVYTPNGNVSSSANFFVYSNPTLSDITVSTAPGYSANPACMRTAQQVIDLGGPAIIDLDNSLAGGVWSVTSGGSLVSFDQNGRITGLNEGSATIRYTVTTNGCSSYKETTVTFYKPVEISTYTSQQTATPYDAGFPTTTGVASYSVSATGTGLTYQWWANDGIDDYKLGNGSAGTTASIVNEQYAGYNSATLNITNIDENNQGFEYYCVVSGSAPCASQTTSPNSTLSVATTGIATDPASVTLCPTVTPSSATFTVVKSGNDTVTYEWEYRKTLPSVTAWTTVPNGAIDASGITASNETTDQLSVSNIVTANNGYQFRANVVGPGNTAISNPATLTVNIPVSGVSVVAAPANATNCASGGSTTFTVSNTTGTVTGIQWQYSTTGLAGSWSNVSNATPVGASYIGATGTSLQVATTNATPASGTYYYRAVLTGVSQCGATNSSTVQLLINNPTTTSPAPQVVIGGASAQFTATATATSPTFVWQYSTNGTTNWNPVADETPATVSYSVGGTSPTSILTVLTSAITNASTANYYRVVVTSNGCTVNSNAAQLTINNYCMSGLTNNSTSTTRGITKVVLSNVSDATSVDSGTTAIGSPYYTYYDNVGPLNIAQGQNGSTAITFGSAGSNYSAVWIDYDHDGTFSSAENVGLATSTNASSRTFTFTVPLSAQLGVTRIRVRGGYTTAAYLATDACTPLANGETEDYLVNITAIQPPTITSLGAAEGCAGNNITINGTNLLGATAAGVTIGGTPVSAIVSNSGTQIVATIGTGTTGTVLVTAAGGTTSTGPSFIVYPIPNAVTVTGGGNICTSTALISASLVGTGTIYFQGTNATGTSTATPSTTEIVSASGTYYFRALAGSGCWGPAGSAVVTLVTPPVAPTTTNYNVCVNGTIPTGQGITSTSVGAALVGSQTINFNVTAQPTETNALPGNVVASATMAALPTGAVITGATITYNNITPQGGSYQSDVKLGLSGALVNAAASGTGAGGSTALLQPFTYTRTATDVTGTVTGGTVNLLYWDADNDVTSGADALFATGNVASVVVNYTYPNPNGVEWYTAATGGSLVGTGSPFNPIGKPNGLPNTATAGTYTYYAQVNSQYCNSTRTAADLIVGAPLTATATPSITTTICGGTQVTLTGASTGGGGTVTYSWKVGTTEVSTATTFNVTPATTTTYVLTVTDACLATQTASVTINVNPAPTAVVVSTAGSYCTSTTLTAANGGSGTIYFQGTTAGGTSTATASSSQLITTSGTYYFRAQSAAGCWGPEGSAVVTIDTAPTAVSVTPATNCQGSSTLATMGATITGCSGFSVSNSFTLPNIAAGDPSYTRSVGGTSYSASTSVVPYTTMRIMPTTTGTYTINGCGDGDTHMQLYQGTFTPGSPSTNFVEANDDDNTNCTSDPRITRTLTGGQEYILVYTPFSASTAVANISITVTPPAGGNMQTYAVGTTQWYAAASGGSPIGTGVTFNPVGVAGSGLANTNTPGVTTYYVACSGAPACRTAVTYTINAKPTLTVSGAITPACGATTANLTSVVTSNGTVTYFSNAGYTTAVAAPTAVTTAGTYYVRATSVAGCTTDSTITVNTFKSIPVTPTISASGVTTFCAGGSVVLTASASAGNSYLWSNGATTSSITVSESGSFTVQVISPAGCSSAASAQTTVTVTSQPTWYLDADGDHYYTGTGIVQCASPGTGYTTSGLLGGGDCNDGVAAINPGAAEICYNNIDDNCNNTMSEACAPVVVNMTPSYNNTTLPSLATAVPAVTYTYGSYTNLKYRFKITNITTGAAPVEIIQTTRYVTIPASLHAYNCQYTITASAVINDEVVPYAGNTITVNSPSVTLVTLTSANCGATLASLTSTLSANPGLNATGYTFRIRLNDTNPSPTYAYSQSATRFINANSFTGFPLQYASSYKVSVQFTFNDPVLGQVESGYGAECIVNTPGIPVISMASPTCGSQVSAMNANIAAGVAAYSTSYQFRIRLFNDNGPTPTYYYSVPNASRFSSLTAFQGATLAYNTAYSISVQYSILNGSTTVWSGYGPECKVTTPFFPVTSLVPSQCGLPTATSLTQQLNITPYPSFPHYMVKLEEVSGETIVNSQEREIAYSYFKLSDFSIAQLGKNYNVSVKIKLNGVFGDYDTACDLFTAAPGKTNTYVPFTATASPNPFANNFTLNVKSSSQSNVNVRVYDMVGRLIEQKVVRMSDMETMTIGDNYPTGVYNVVVSQEESVQTVRVVKR